MIKWDTRMVEYLRIKTLMEEIEKTQINGKIFHVHGLEELILLKYPYYPKQLTD